MIKCKMLSSEKGQTLMFAIIVVIVLLVFVSTLNKLLNYDTRLTMKHKRSTTAFHLAEAAVDRGIWKLKESKDVWNGVESWTSTYPYKGGKDFDDIEGGEYRITISTTSNENERKIIGWGRDDSTNELRTIEVIVKNVTSETSIVSPDLYVGGAAIAHWGPMKSHKGGMDLQGNSINRWYPRKYAAGPITNRDIIDDDDNTDDTEYWAYHSVPTPPGIGIADYREESKVGDNEYHPGDADFNGHADDSHAGDPKIYFVEQNCTLKNTYLKGTLIVMGNLTINSSNSHIDYNADIPEDAEDEYQDDEHAFGGKTPQEYWNWKFAPTAPTFFLEDVLFEGFIYVAGTLSATGGVINGCIQVGPIGNTSGLGNLEIYYNDTIAKGVKTTELNIKQVSWKEIVSSW